MTKSSPAAIKEAEEAAPPPAAEKAAYLLARQSLAAAREKATKLRERLVAVDAEIVERQAALSEAGERMASSPDDLAKSQAFSEVTSQLTNLEAQRAALRDRLIPEADSQIGEVAGELETAHTALNRADFRSAVREKLLPADRRWVAAIAEMESALEASQAVRVELRSEDAFRPFWEVDRGMGQKRDFLATGTLRAAVTFGLARFIHTYAASGRHITASTPIQDIVALHIQNFGLEE
ncbi:hypothetical protein [Caulobacter sp. S45]|uniref:hypothetical protein n=1 Tax=Caulobacter sp. S45 TaxID=1641861 RepID=UPI00131C7132|nr:hypothetical protein [Caulobacter sp. S45]